MFLWASTGIRTGCLLLLLLPRAQATETDPFTSLDPEVNRAIVMTLLPTLTAADGNDPAWGRAEMALVNLVLAGDLSPRSGRSSPWRQKARELRVERQRRLGDRVPDEGAIIADAWFNLLDGRMTAVNAAMAEPPRADTPHGRALRALVLRDKRILAGSSLTAHERLAQAWVMIQTEPWVNLSDPDRWRLPPLTLWTFSVNSGYTWAVAREEVLKWSLAEAVSVAADSRLPAALRDLTAPLKALIAPGSTTATRHTAVSTMSEAQFGEILAVTWQVLEGIRTAPDAALDDGPLPLRAAATIARTHLCTGVDIYCLGARQTQNPISDGWLRALADGNGILPVLVRSIFADGTEYSHIQLLAAIEQELAQGEYALPPSRMIGWVWNMWLAPRIWIATERRLAVTERLIKAQQVNNARDGSSAWISFASVLDRGKGMNGLASALQQSALDDPWNVPVAIWSAQAARGLIPLWRYAPAVTWVATDVDVAKGGFPQIGRSANIAVRWTGTVAVPTPGLWEFATESDDGSTLAVAGRLVVENSGQQGMIRISGTIELLAGRHPLDLRWYNIGMGASCRLLWRAPGGRDFQVIPPEVLAQEDGQPGLHAEGWLLERAANWQQTDLASLQRGIELMPWRTDVRKDLCQEHLDHCEWAEAAAIGLELRQHGNSAGLAGAIGMALQHLERMDEAVAVWQGALSEVGPDVARQLQGHLARAAEDVEDWSAAEAHWRAAAVKQGVREVSNLARYVARRGRGGEAASLIDDLIGLQGDASHQLALLAARLALAGTAEDIESGLERLATTPALLSLNGSDMWDLGRDVRRMGLHQRFVALAGPQLRKASGFEMPFQLGILYMDLARWQDAHACFVKAANADRLNDQGRSATQIWLALSARLIGNPALGPNATQLASYRGIIRPIITDEGGIIDLLIGELSAADVVQAAAGERDSLLYFAGLLAVAESRLDLADTALHLLEERQPASSEAIGAGQLRAWIARGAPAAPASLPAPIPVGDPANDF